MGKEHKKRKKRKHSKHERESKDGGYHVPIVPLKSETCPKPVAAADRSKKVVRPIGPILPQALSKDESKKDESKPSGREPNGSYGPSLPPHLVQRKRAAPGPSLPLGFKTEEKSEPVDDGLSGFGPLPAELIASDAEQQFVQKQLELRAEYMKRKFAGEVSTYLLT